MSGAIKTVDEELVEAVLVHDVGLVGDCHSALRRDGVAEEGIFEIVRHVIAWHTWVSLLIKAGVR